MNEATINQLILASVEKQGKEIQEIKQTLVTLARVEERLASQRETLERYGTRIDKHENRLSAIELITGTRGVFFKWAERIGLVTAGGLITKLLSVWSV